MNIPTRLLHFILKLVGAKKIAMKGILNPHRSKEFRIPRFLKKEFHTVQSVVNNSELVTFSIRGKALSKHIIFLHGGAYTAEAGFYHWRFIKDVIKSTSYKLSFINYPLAPEHDYQVAHEMVFQAYKRLNALNPNDDFVFMGDSAGGGFCLSFAQVLRNGKLLKLPEKMVLISPWVDISMSNSEIAGLEKKDLLLDPESLLFCSQNFAGELDLKEPIVSPLYGDMQDLNSIGIFVGTDEILLPDCRKLRKKLMDSNTSFFYKEYEGMQHDWMILPIKERTILLEDIVDYLKK